MKRVLSFALCLLMVFGMVIVSGAAETEVHAAGGKTLAELQAMFPHGKYWNGGNPNGYTDSPCTHHRHDYTKDPPVYYVDCDFYGNCKGEWPPCNSYSSSIQCMGYAYKLADLAYGINNSKDWSKNYDKDSAMANLKAGDVVRYSPTGFEHSIFVTDVQGDTVYFTDCNYDGPCQITWAKDITKEEIKDSFSYAQHAPYALDGETRTPVDVGTNFYAAIINTELWSSLTNDDRNVSIRKNAEQDKQIWHFERQSDGSYKISSYKDGLVLDAENSGTTPGTNIGVWEDKGADNQRWYIYGESARYVFKPKYSDLVMDVYKGNSEDGTNVQLWSETGGDEQLFQIWKVIPAATTVYSTAGSDCQPTKIWWDKADEATQYTVKIWNGVYTEGEPYKVLWDVTDLSCEVDLPAGYYEAYVDAANKWHYTRSSNIVQFTVAEGGHTFGEWEMVTEPTCTSMGEEQRTCTNCGKRESRAIEMTAHIWSDTYTVQLAPTCTATGLETRLCTACSAIDPDSYREIPANGHSFGEWTMDADSSCTEGGSESRTCMVCGHTETRNVDPIEHSWQSIYTVDKASTCTEDGSESIHCENCSAIKDSRTIPATGHSFGEWLNIMAATCTESGTEEHICSVCSHSERREVTAQGHIWGTVYTVDIPVTCTEDGSESIHCENCDTVKDTRVIAATGHQWQNDFTIDIEPTETEDGRKSIHCENCDAVKDVMTIPATGTPKPTEKPSEDLSYMLKIEGEGEIQITEGLKAAGIGSIEQVKERLLACVLQNEGYTAEKTDLMEILLRVSADNGYTWRNVSAENFPESGEVRVTLPYPQGAPKDTPKENYKVYHMFTENINGHKAGEIEECPVEKIDEGLLVTLHGLSPVIIAWTPVNETVKPTSEPTAAPSTEPTSAPSATPNATPTDAPSAAPTEKPAVDAPQTGDNGVSMLWFAVLLVSGSAAAALFLRKRVGKR